MHQDDWSRLKELFQDAASRTGQERLDYVDGACRRYPHLEAALRQLIASDSSAGDFMETPAYADITDRSTHPDAADTLRPGDIVNGTYEVQSTLGAGGMGVVYRVVHRGLKRTFAAKVIHAAVASDSGFLERFEREAVALGRLKHPNVVDVTDYGVERLGTERAYLIMECLDGVTLAEELRAGPLPVEDALQLFEPVAAGLDYAHSQGVLHLDLKPANVLLHRRGSESAEVKILDFGLAQFTNERATDSVNTPLAGTPAYLAPELLDGRPAGPAADIYAFSVLMYEALTGRPPFEGTVADVLEQQRRSIPLPPSTVNSAVPAHLDAVLLDLLAKDPDARPPTAHAALSRLRSALTAHQQHAWRRTELPRRAIVSVAVAIALGAISPLLHAWNPLQRLELMTVDARYAAVPSRHPSGDIVLLMLDDASLAADPAPLVERADAFGSDLRRVLHAGARGVAIDFLLPASWSDSSAFTRLVLEHADRLTLAAYSSPAGEVVGPECIAGTTTVALGPQQSTAMFGFINLDQDVDGVSRRGRLSFTDRQGTRRPAFAARAASTYRDQTAALSDGRDDRFWIDHRIDLNQFTRMSWKDLDAALRDRPELFKGRTVLAGADYAGSGDEPRVPGRDAVPGVALHAVTLQTILEGFPIRGLGTGGLILLSGVGSALLCGAALLLRPALVLVVSAAAVVGGVASSGALLAWGGLVVPLVVPVGLWLAASAIGSSVARARAPYPAHERPALADRQPIPGGPSTS